MNEFYVFLQGESLMVVPSVTGPVGWKNYRHNWIFYLSRIQRGLRKSCAALRRIARYTLVLKHLLSDINELAVKRSKYKTKKRGSLGAGGIVLSFYDIFLRRCYASSGTNAMQRGVVKRGKPQKSTIDLFISSKKCHFFVLACQRCQYFERIERCRLMPLFRESRKNLRPPNVPSHGAGGPWFLSFSRIHMQMSFIRPSADDFASCQLCTKRPLYLINSRNSINTSSI